MTLDDIHFGARVLLDVPAIEPVSGRVAFFADGWLYWTTDDGQVHASRLDALRCEERP